VGPYVSVGAHTHIENSRIQTSLIQTYSKISNASFQDSMLGNYVQLKGKIAEVDIGDYNTVIG
jgi:glucose-1-phosphate thymidylyltransferase